MTEIDDDTEKQLELMRLWISSAKENGEKEEDIKKSVIDTFGISIELCNDLYTIKEKNLKKKKK